MLNAMRLYPFPQTPSQVELRVARYAADGDGDGGASSFVELSNPQAFAADVSGWSLRGAVAFAFPPGMAARTHMHARIPHVRAHARACTRTHARLCGGAITWGRPWPAAGCGAPHPCLPLPCRRQW